MWKACAAIKIAGMLNQARESLRCNKNCPNVKPGYGKLRRDAIKNAISRGTRFAFWRKMDSTQYWILKMNIVSPGFEPFDPSMTNGFSAFSYLTCWWVGVLSDTNVFVYRRLPVRTCLKITNYEQFRTNCCAKIAATFFIIFDERDIGLLYTHNIK